MQERRKRIIPPWQVHAKQIVDEYISRRTGLTAEEINSDRRYKEYVEARALAYLILREKYKMQMVVIGQLYKKDHTTVINGLEVAKKLHFKDTMKMSDFPELSPYPQP